MSSEIRDIASLQLWLAKRYRMDSCHDYELASSGVMRLGCYEEIAAEIAACLKDNWNVTEVHRVQDSGWVRINIILKGNI
jgi:hypothetical protein